MTEIDIEDGTPLFEKIMAHFGWYKAKKVCKVEPSGLLVQSIHKRRKNASIQVLAPHLPITSLAK